MRVVCAAGLAPIADAAMARWFTPDFRRRDAETVARFRATFERTRVEGYVGCCAALRDGDLAASTHGVACPTLVIAGRADEATTPEQGRWLASQVQHPQYAELDAAHLSNVERAEQFTDVVCRFLGEDQYG